MGIIQLSFNCLIYIFIFSFYTLRVEAQTKVFENGNPTRIGRDISYHIDTPTRRKIDLAGVWQYSIDGSSWNNVLVPSSFDYEGQIIFLKKFNIQVDELKERNFRFIAFGINNDAEIYINDTFIGKHSGSSVSFELDIPTNALFVGSENVIKIIVNNVLTSSTTLPVRKQIYGWRNYCGIIRDIFILSTPLQWIEVFEGSATLDSTLLNGKISGKLSLSSKSTENTDTLSANRKSYVRLLTFELIDRLTGAIAEQFQIQQVSLEENRTVTIPFSLNVTKPTRWSPEVPDFYFLRVSLYKQEGKQKQLIDQVEKTFGFCNIRTDGGNIKINNELTHVNGVVWIEDSYEYGASLTYDRMERDITLIKMLGANAVRFAFHSPHPYMIDLCTRYGLLALEEVPVYMVPVTILESDYYLSLTESVLQEMIERDRHQVSLLALGIGSGFDSFDHRGNVFVENVTKKIKMLSNSLIYFGSITTSSDIVSGSVDFAAISIMDVDVKKFKEILNNWKKLHPEKPIIVTQYGKNVEPDNRKGYSDPMSYEAQGRFFIQCFQAIRDVKLAGGFVNSFADWRGDRPTLKIGLKDPYLYTYGIMTRQREKRAAYDVIRSLYKNERVTALPIGMYKASFPIIHIVTGLIIIFLLAYQYNYNRRFSETFKRALLHPYNFFVDLRDLRIASIVQTFILSVLMSLTLGVLFSSILYHYRNDVFADIVITQIVVWDWLKEQLIFYTWHPFEGVLVFSTFFFVALLLFILLVRIGGLLVGARINMFHSFAVAVWASVPVIFLGFLAMILFKLMETPQFIIPSFVIIVAILFWVFSRLVQGIAVLYDIRGMSVILIGAGALIFIIGASSFFYLHFFSAYHYFEFIVNIARGSI